MHEQKDVWKAVNLKGVGADGNGFFAGQDADTNWGRLCGNWIIRKWG